MQTNEVSVSPGEGCEESVAAQLHAATKGYRVLATVYRMSISLTDIFG